MKLFLTVWRLNRVWVSECIENVYSEHIGESKIALTLSGRYICWCLKHHKLYHPPSCLRAVPQAYPNELQCPNDFPVRQIIWFHFAACSSKGCLLKSVKITNRGQSKVFSHGSLSSVDKQWKFSMAVFPSPRLSFLFIPRLALRWKNVFEQLCLKYELTMRYVYSVLNSVNAGDVYSLLSTDDDDDDFVGIRKPAERTETIVLQGGLPNVLSVHVF